MLGISLLQYVHQQAKSAWADLSVEAIARGTAADQTARSALSTSRREGTAAHGLCAFAAGYSEQNAALPGNPAGSRSNPK
jgi:hypothetical protein